VIGCIVTPIRSKSQASSLRTPDKATTAYPLGTFYSLSKYSRGSPGSSETFTPSPITI